MWAGIQGWGADITGPLGVWLGPSYPAVPLLSLTRWWWPLALGLSSPRWVDATPRPSLLARCFAGQSAEKPLWKRGDAAPALSPPWTPQHSSDWALGVAVPTRGAVCEHHTVLPGGAPPVPLPRPSPMGV